MKKKWLATIAAGALLFSPLSQADNIKVNACVFDIGGNSGPVMSLMKDWKVAALDWGLNVSLKPYTSEGIATADLGGGACDMAVITGLRARKFIKYTGTLDSVGSITNIQELHTVLKLLASPQLASKVTAHGFVNMGIVPAGPAYFFVNDRSINTVSKAAGKKVAVLSYDKTQAQMVATIGATPVDSDVTNFSTKFNNGIVDIVGAPLAAYDALELYKGMTPNGGIIDFPLMQITFQIIGNTDVIPAEAAQKSRTYVYNRLPQALEMIKESKAGIPDKWWVEVPEADKPGYNQLMQKARITIRDMGAYDADMLTLLRKVRCKFDSSRSECTDPVE